MGVAALHGASDASARATDRYHHDRNDRDDGDHDASHRDDPDEASSTVESSDESGSNFPKIVAACIGVLFGGAIAAWQIRAMRKRA